MKNMSSWQWLRVIMQQNIVHPSGYICLLVVFPEILRSLNRFNFQFNDLLIDIILYMLWHFDAFHFNSNFQVLWKMYNILAIKIYFGLSVICEMSSLVNFLN